MRHHSPQEPTSKPEPDFVVSLLLFWNCCAAVVQSLQSVVSSQELRRSQRPKLKWLTANDIWSNWDGGVVMPRRLLLCNIRDTFQRHLLANLIKNNQHILLAPWPLFDFNFRHLGVMSCARHRMNMRCFLTSHWRRDSHQQHTQQELYR